ncbi:MAG: sigma-54-dependent Fis family transcriptional regulator [Myxococcales bacterium]|nr:sigma-54-dependent Fis family transcriptional regulator [Myxococcales bacterium]
MRPDATTLTEDASGRPSLPPTRRLAVTVAWCEARPDLVGAIGFLEPTPRFLGRAIEPRDGVAPLAFVHQRPGRNEPVRPLDLPAISRVQLLASAPDDERAVIENRGKCALLIDGAALDRVELDEGRTFCLGEQALFLVTTRPEVLPPTAHWDEPRFPFGAPDPLGLVGESEAAWALRDAVAHAARHADHVLVRGPSGVGKELVARGLHALSARSAGPFVARNAATIPESLMAAELFGSRSGYPNAGAPERSGLIGAAHGGTLFLDEIGELPHTLQAALLRVMDPEGSYQRLGESEVRSADLRVVGATNRPLDALKPDLRARFSLPLEVPSLDDRREDIPLLVRHLVADWQTPVSLELVDRLLAHDHALNVRELRTLLVQARALGRRPLRPPEALTGATPARGGSPEEIDEPRLRAALERHEGVVANVWRELGLKNRYVLRRLLAKHGIDPARYRR